MAHSGGEAAGFFYPVAPRVTGEIWIENPSYYRQSIFERFFMLFSFLEVNPLESINCRVLCHHFTALLKIQKILVKS